MLPALSKFISSLRGCTLDAHHHAPQIDFILYPELWRKTRYCYYTRLTQLCELFLWSFSLGTLANSEDIKIRLNLRGLNTRAPSRFYGEHFERAMFHKQIGNKALFVFNYFTIKIVLLIVNINHILLYNY